MLRNKTSIKHYDRRSLIPMRRSGPRTSVPRLAHRKMPYSRMCFWPVRSLMAMSLVTLLIGDVREPLNRVTNKQYGIPQFVGHLKKFVSDRGPVLQGVGEQWKRRYRFYDPLMRPYVVLKGIDAGLIDEKAIDFSDYAPPGQHRLL